MASMRDIKRRRSSIASTQQITNAMKLVSTVKLQKTKARAERSKPYFDKMYATVTSMLAKSGTIDHPYLKPQPSEKKTVVHEPKLLKLLPVEVDEADLKAADSGSLMNYEPEEEEALEIIIPKYITSILFGALVEAVASENGARMQAMDSATSNAQEMIDKLTLQYNRARQGSITQELTEIIAGANAIE